MVPTNFQCNAGYNVASVLPDGTVNPCFNKREKPLGNIFSEFHFNKDLLPCSAEFCDCPLYSFEEDLHKIAKNLPARDLNYDAFIHWHITYSCNLHCNYCTLFGTNKEKDFVEKNIVPKAVNIQKVIHSLDQTGHTFLISFIGGEPFLVPNINELCAELTKKHHICFNTNLTALDPTFFQKVNLSHLGQMHISLHIEALERHGLTKRFIANVNEMQRIGYDRFYITTVAHPNILKKLDFYRKQFAKHNISFKLIPMLDGGGASPDGKPYPESYTKEQLEQIEKSWLDDYFPQKKQQNEKVELSDYHDPIKNPDKRG